MTLDQVLAEITRKITCVPFHDDRRIEDWSLTPTGEPFLTFCSGGVREEGEHPPCLCYTQEGAVELWRLALMDYANRKPGILYWREMPKISNAFESPGDGDDVWLRQNADGEAVIIPMFLVYSRFLISDRPALRAYSRAA